MSVIMEKIKIKRDFSLSTGLVLYLLAVCAATSILIIVFLYWFLSRHGDAELLKKVKEYCYHLESSVERPLWLYDEETLKLTAENFFKSTPITSLKILDSTQENILYENHINDDSEMISYHGNIIYRGELIGLIKIGLSTKEYKANLNRIMYSVIFVIFSITGGLLIFIYLFIGNYITKPLMVLLDGINAISKGDYNYRFEKFRQVEFTKITAAFHEMEDQVNNREKSLKTINIKFEIEIDERKKVESALRESEDKFRRLAQTTSAGIMVYQDDKWVYANPAAQRLSAYSLDELKSMPFWDLFAESYKESVKDKGEKRQKNIEAESGYEAIIISKLKERKWVYIEGNTTEYLGRPAGIVSVIDITERKEAEKGMKLARKFIDNIINSMPSVLLSVDSDLNVKQWNKKAINKTGVSSDFAHGKPLFEVFPYLKEEEKKINEAIKTRSIRRTQKRESFYNERTIYEDIIIYPLFSEDIEGAVIRVDDVTDRVLLNEAVIDAETIRQSSKAKSEFLANMSHEMRTPLNGVIGMSTLLLDTKLDEEQSEYLEIVQKSGENLLAIINDILDFSKIDAGKLDLDLIDFDLRKVIDDVADMVSCEAYEKDIELIHFTDPQIPSRVKGDPARLKQVLLKLAENAVKFTKKGEVVIRSEVSFEEEDNISLKFYVHDTGIGIENDKIENLFRPFEQLDGSATREYGGTGLGLSISKQLAEFMGGSIGAKSKPGKGSTFFVELPFKTASDAEIEETIHFNPLDNKKVLIVDDNKTNRLLLKNLLNFWGCNFDEAENGFKALEILRDSCEKRVPFEIALLDMSMPGMDGIELGKRIVSDNLITTPVLIMMSSIAQRGDLKNLHKSGFSAYLTKPVKRDQLKKCMSMVIGFDPQPHESKILTEGSVDYLTSKGKKILIAEDNGVNQHIFMKHVSKAGYDSDVVSNGYQAIEKLKKEGKNYCLIFMDCQMPKMDGYETAGRIKSGECGPLNIPIIALTANVLKDDRAKCLKSGMDDYLAKPVRAHQIEEIINKWVEKKSDNKMSNIIAFK